MLSVTNVEKLFRVHPDAVTRVLEVRGDSEERLRVGVRPGGCSGFSYEMFLDEDAPGEGDVVESHRSLSGEVLEVMVDRVSAGLLGGATLLFEPGLQGGFKFENPNASRACGCGSSFS